MNLRIPLPVAFCAMGAMALLAGCASAPRDAGMPDVARIARERTGNDLRWQRSTADTTAARERTDRLLAKPLDMAAAVELALFNNPDLQARLADLGIAAADLDQAGRLANPGFGYKNTTANGATAIERSLSFNLVSLLLAPQVSKLEARRFDQTRLAVADDALRLARDTRIAWTQAVAAQQAAARLEKLAIASEGAAMIADGMAKRGNFSRLEQSREALRHAETTWQLQRARDEALRTREALVRLLGLGADAAQLKLPDVLSDLPDALPEPGDVEAIALERRLDVQAARAETAAVAESLGLTRTTRFINVIEAGPVRTTQGGGPRESGYEVRLEVPLFDWGSARVDRAEARYMQSVQQLAATANRARSAAREAWTGYRLACDTALHYRDQVLPLRQAVSEETLKHYNGMLISVFDLLADSREDTGIAIDAIHAARDAWSARAELEYALGGSLPLPAAAKEKNHD